MLDEQSCQLPAFHLGPDDIPHRQRFDAMREIIRPLYEALPSTDEPSSGMAFSAYVLDDIAVNRSTFERHRLARGPQHLRQHDTDHIAARLYVRGRTTAVMGDLPLLVATGSVTLFDRRYQMHGEAEPGLVYGCMLPRQKIDTRAFDRTPAITWPVSSPQGRLLSSALMTTWRVLPQAAAADAAQLASGLIGLVNGLLSSRPEASEVVVPDEATRTAVKAFIEQRLHESDLDVATLCRTFACSRAHLYRLFRACGGVERYLRNRRLQRCLDELTGTPPSGKRIGAVVAAWGFDDPSHFHRLFKARFGMTPSDASALGRDLAHGRAAIPPEQQSAEVAQLHRWLSRI